MGNYAFSLPFALFSVDLYFNGPMQEPAKNLGLAASLLAVLIGRFEVFVLAELLWCSLLIRTRWLGLNQSLLADKRERTAENDALDLPVEGEKRLNDSLKKLKKNVGDVTCDGETWTLVKEEEDVKVFSANFPGKSILRWKVSVQVPNTTQEILLRELFDFNKRAGANGWDGALREGKIIREYRGGTCQLSRMVTNTAAGGVVSPREFFDLRIKSTYNSDDDFPSGTVLVASVGLKASKDSKWFPAIPKPDKSLVSGMNHAGGGVRISPVKDKPNCWQYDLVVSMDMGGWVPMSAINAATGSALLESHLQMRTHLETCK